MKKYTERVWLVRWNFVSKQGDVIALEDALKCDDSEDWEIFYVMNDNHPHEGINTQEAIDLAIAEFCAKRDIPDAAFDELNRTIY